MPSKPADRKPKQDSDAYTFRHKGKVYRLPAGENVSDKLPGRFLRDAAMDGTEGQLRLSFAMLELVDGSPGALDALYEMPATQMMEHIEAWMNHKGSEDEPSVGESSPSSD
jgi:hypothetical protein